MLPVCLRLGSRFWSNKSVLDHLIIPFWSSWSLDFFRLKFKLQPSNFIPRGVTLIPWLVFKEALITWFNFDPSCKRFYTGHISDYPLFCIRYPLELKLTTTFWCFSSQDATMTPRLAVKVSRFRPLRLSLQHEANVTTEACVLPAATSPGVCPPWAQWCRCSHTATKTCGQTVSRSHSPRIGHESAQRPGLQKQTRKPEYNKTQSYFHLVRPYGHAAIYNSLN